MFPEITNQQINTHNSQSAEKSKDNSSAIIDDSQISPLWLSVSEAAKLGGVQTKTIRRAIKANAIRFKITRNRYLIDFSSLVSYLHSSTKLKNKFNQFGIGQYVDSWKK